MFWTEKYRPADLAAMAGQDRVREVLSRFAGEKMLPHLLISGPHGTGKTTATAATLLRLYGPDWHHNTTIIRTSDLMERGRSYLETDERFMSMYRPDESFLSNLKHVINTYAGIRPIDSPFKVLWFEDAQSLSQDIQHALRRIMERYSATCRFIFCSTNTSCIIPPIASRCLPLYMTPVSPDYILHILKDILIKEEIPEGTIPDDELKLMITAAKGDVRRAIMYLQVRVQTRVEFNPDSLGETETRAIASAAFRAMQERDFFMARNRLETMMVTHGLSGREVLEELNHAARREYNDPKITACIAETDYILTHANNEFIQINALAAKIIGEVFL